MLSLSINSTKINSSNIANAKNYQHNGNTNFCTNNLKCDKFEKNISNKNVSFTGYFPDECHSTQIKQIVNLIKRNKNNKIILLAHKSPDGDAIGSMLALKRLIEKSTGNKNVNALTFNNLPHNLQFVDKNKEIRIITKDFKVPSANDKEFLSKLNEQYGEAPLLITTDVSCLNMIDTAFKSLIKTAKNVIKIDHHPEGENFGNINLVDEKKESASQLVMQMVKPLGIKTKDIDSSISDPIALGVLSDSGSFAFAKTHEIFTDTSKLSTTSSIGQITREMNKMTPQEFQTYNNLLNSVRFSPDGKIAYYFVDMAQNHYVTKEINRNVLTSISNIDGVKYYFSISGSSKKRTSTIMASIRSSSKEILNAIKSIGGNGHEYSCGLMKKNSTMYEIKDLILDKLEALGD